MDARAEDAEIHSHGFSRSGTNMDAGGKNPVPLAYIASVIRNPETFNLFLALAETANLYVKDLTEQYKPFDLLPYMQSYDRSTVRLFTLSSSCK